MANMDMVGYPDVNLALVRLGDGGQVDFHTSASLAQFSAHIQGYVVDGADDRPGAVIPLTPARLLDTTTGLGAASAAPVPAGGSLTLDVTGRAGVPASGVAAVLVNMTVRQPKSTGSLAVYPFGDPAPEFAQLPFARSDEGNTLVQVAVREGRAVISNRSKGTVHVQADVQGYVVEGAATAPGTMRVLQPERVLDTAIGIGIAAKPVPKGGSVLAQIGGVQGIPATAEGAALINVTVSNARGYGFLPVYPAGQPLSSGYGGVHVNRLFVTSAPLLVPLGTGGRIQFRNGAGGTLDLAVDVVGYVPAPDSAPPGPVTNLEVTATTSASATLAWANPGDVDFAGVLVRRTVGDAAATSPTDGEAVADVSAPGAAVTADGLTPETTYTFTLFTYDTTGNYSAGVPVTATTPPEPDVQAPGPVTNLEVTATTPTSATLAWTNPGDADYAGVLVRRTPGTTAATSPTDGDAVADVGAPGVTTTADGLAPETTYTFTLFTYDTTGNYSAGVPVTATTPPEPDVQAPGPVTNLEVTATTPTSATLAWTNPGDADFSTVLIRRATGATPPTLTTGDEVASLDAPTTTFTDTGLEPGTEYSYAVFTQDTSGNTADPATVTATTDPVPDGWLSVTAGTNFLCGVRADNSAWCSGDNGSGQLGYADVLLSPGFVRVAGEGGWATIDAGALHACGVKLDGTAWCWGSNREGQLGNGSTSDDPQLLPIQVGTHDDWTSIDAGGQYTCGLRDGGTAWCWGAGANAVLGMLGNGTEEPSLVPVQVAGDAQWAEVRAGWYHTCGRKTDGTAWCWGLNFGGQLGNADTSTQISPVPVTGGGTWQDLTVGQYHTCGIRTDGSAWCWGYNLSSVVGDGTQVDRSAPAPVSGGGSWVSLAAGIGHTCGVRTEGTLWCWGDNTLKQLGNDVLPSSAVPTQVGDSATWASVTATDYATLALMADDSGWRWGSRFWTNSGESTPGPERF